MVRGEFIRGDGLILPNNVTKYGTLTILLGTFKRNQFDFYMGLGNGLYVDDLLVANMDSPTAGGYVKQLLPFADWTLGEVNGEQYAESGPAIFPATGSYGKTVTRPFLTQNVDVTKVVALGSPLPTPLLVEAATPIAQRTFKYRMYMR